MACSFGHHKGTVCGWNDQDDLTALTSAPFFQVHDVSDGLNMEMAMLGAVAGSGAPSAFLWQAMDRSLVLPERYTKDASFDKAAADSAARGWPVATRKTGGGITPQGPGVLNLALAFCAPAGQSRSILASYANIVNPMKTALSDIGVRAEAKAVAGSFCDGDYNLAVDGRKLVGTAQRWRGTTCLIHALVMTDIDLSPAVDAVSTFSQDLGHATVFDDAMHCRLADLLPGERDLNTTVVMAVWQAVSASGYAPFSP